MNNKKLMKSAGIIEHLLKIVQGFMAAGVIISAVFIPLTLIFGEKVIAKSDSHTLSLGNLSLRMTELAYQSDSIIKTSIISTLVLVMVICAIGWYGIKVLRSILQFVKDGKPFAQGISDLIRKLAIIALIGGGISEIGGLVISFLELRLYDLSNVFDKNIVTGLTYNFEINFNFAILAGVIFILSYVFRYGEELQKESDETL